MVCFLCVFLVFFVPLWLKEGSTTKTQRAQRIHKAAMEDQFMTWKKYSRFSGVHPLESATGNGKIRHTQIADSTD